MPIASFTKFIGLSNFFEMMHSFLLKLEPPVQLTLQIILISVEVSCSDILNEFLPSFLRLQ